MSRWMTVREVRLEEARTIRALREVALVEQNSRCAYCHELLTRTTATADHRKARFRGGRNERRNIKAACQPCNLLKGKLSEKTFLRRLRHPGPDDSFRWWMAHMRWRLNRRAKKACERILASVSVA